MQSVLGIAVVAVGLLLAALLAVGIIDGNRFEVVKEEFFLSGLSQKCRFVLISDLHNQVYGNKNEKLIHTIKNINPDFIVVAGDLVTSEEKEDMTPGIELIQILSRDYKIYYGLGNHESKIKNCPERFGNQYHFLKSSLTNKNVCLLENESVEIPKYNIQITGLELDLKYFAHFRKCAMEQGYLQQMIAKPIKDKCNLLIAHNPDYFEEYAQWGADLVVSGHVHGGIMKLPFLGGVLAPSLRIFPKYDGGVYKEGKTVMLLGRGLGSHTIKLRFFNPAQLYEVTLKPKL